MNESEILEVITNKHIEFTTMRNGILVVHHDNETLQPDTTVFTKDMLEDSVYEHFDDDEVDDILDTIMTWKYNKDF